MIYFYKKVDNHDIYKLHEYLEFFFKQLFKNDKESYDHDFFIHDDFQSIVDKYEEKIDKKLESIFDIYLGLDEAKKAEIQHAYEVNNKIEEICSCECDPIKYEELPKGFSEKLKALYDNLWSPIIGYKYVKEVCGTLKQHSEDFKKINKFSVCPFCGIHSLLPPQDEYRDAYDHYLPKSKYSFISVNFLNLVPMCHDCNSNRKKANDIPYKDDIPDERRELYYPFASNVDGHKIHVKLNRNSLNLDLKKRDGWSIEIICDPAENNEKKESWVAIFDIKDRYKALISKKSYHWSERLMLRYRKTKEKYSFQELKEEFQYSYSDTLYNSEAIVKECYYEYLFDKENLEAHLNGRIS